MAAMWKAHYEVQDGTNRRDYLYYYAADARSMSRAALKAATRNAVKRAKDRLAKRGLKVRVLAVNCVG